MKRLSTPRPGDTAKTEGIDPPERLHTVRSEIILPPNTQFKNWATEDLRAMIRPLG